MGPRGRSWHIPCISKYNAPDPDQCLHVVLLQRVSDEEHDRIVETLKEVDEEWTGKLDVPHPPSRTLEIKKWIRDYWPSSDVILEIARHADSDEGYNEKRYPSMIFVDSGWESSNCIAARWEGVGDDMRLNAVRVPLNIAKTLLSACDFNEGHTLASILGNEKYKDSKVDLYVDATESQETPQTPSDGYKLPDSLPQDLALSQEEILIICLKELEQTELEKLKDDILQGNDTEDPAPPIKVFQCPIPDGSRREIRKIFNRIYQNSSEKGRVMPLFLVDALLESKTGQPELLAAIQSTQNEQHMVQLQPIKIGKLLEIREDAILGNFNGDSEELGDIWNQEFIFDLEVQQNFGLVRGAPVFNLMPFTLDQERTVRSRLRDLNDIEEDEDWGKDFTYFGYLWPDAGQKHTVEDLRDLFESCDRYSPSFDSSKPGPYRIDDYPHHFIAVDDKILEPEAQVWLVSSLDFSLDDVSDDLGWIYGLVAAKDVHLNWVNLDIANMGPEEMIDHPQKLWLSDLKEAKADWEKLEAEEFA